MPSLSIEHPQLYRHPDDCKVRLHQSAGARLLFLVVESNEAAVLQVWGRRRVTLAGDAAHLATPVLAQGSSQAFEDAVALGRAIGKSAC